MKNLQDIHFLTISKIYSKKSKTTIPTATIEIESSQVLFPSSSLSILNFHREKKRATSPYFPFSTPKKPFIPRIVLGHYPVDIFQILFRIRTSIYRKNIR